MRVCIGSHTAMPSIDPSRPGTLKCVPCRDPDKCGAMLPLLPGQTKQQVFCPTCQYKHREAGCIYYHRWDPNERAESEALQRWNTLYAKDQHVCSWEGCGRWAGKKGTFCPEHASRTGHGITPGSEEDKWQR